MPRASYVRSARAMAHTLTNWPGFAPPPWPTFAPPLTDHPNAEEIYVRVRGLDDSVSLATVYRTLSTLEEAGLVQRLNLENEPARFEITPAAAHDHLVDVDTGQVIELPSEEMNRLRDEIAAKLGYEVVNIHSFVRARKIKTKP